MTQLDAQYNERTGRTKTVRNKTLKTIGRRFVGAALLLLVITPLSAGADPGVLEHHSMLRDNIDIESGIWGKVAGYTGRSIVLESGQRYHFARNVLVDVENLAPNRRGNVRVFLNDVGKATTVFFHGIDMPEVLNRYGN